MWPKLKTALPNYRQNVLHELVAILIATAIIIGIIVGFLGSLIYIINGILR